MPDPAAVRASLDGLSDLSGRDVRAVVVSAASAEQAAADLIEAIPVIVEQYGSAAAALAADGYDLDRLEAGARGQFSAAPLVYAPKPERVESLARWAVAPLFATAPALDAAADRAAQRVALWATSSHRGTTIAAAGQDREAIGWARHARPGACGFCRMLASRGAVYRKETARFAAHPGKCFCTASVVFNTGETGIEASALQYRATNRRMSAADRGRVRDWIAANQ